MRLNWNNIGKGLEGIADAKRASDLAKEAARYDVTEGAYGPGLQENIQQLEGLRAGVADPAQNSYDPQRLAAYDQGIAELTRRQGLTAPDYSVASGAQNFSTRQEARQAAAPLRAEGLAGVYRRYGDVEKADALETRAYEQQRALAAEERAKAGEARSAQDFATRQTETGLRINRLTQEEAERQNYSGFNAYAAENPNATAAELKDAAFKQFKFTPKQWQEAVNTRLGIGENEQKEFVLGIKNKLKGKNLQQLGSLYNSDPDFDDKTDLAIVPGKNGAVTLNFIDKATNKITSSQSFNNEALATEYLNKQATEPETIGSWMLALQKNQAAIDASKASTAKDNSLAARYARDEPEKGLTKKITEMETVLGRKLSPAEKETALGLIGKPRDEKPQKVEEAGVQYKVDGKLVQTDGMGGFMSTKGVLPSDRPAALKAAGVSDNNASRLIWSNDGDAVMFNNEEYNVADKRDMSKLNKALEAYDTMNRKIAEEGRARGNPTGPTGFQGARTTGLGPASSYGVAPNAPSIYGR
jgi:hypothetical protein